jgi:hypothetical protein
MKLSKYIGFALVAFSVLTMTACLKDNPNNAAPGAGTNNVVEFQNTSIPVSYTSIWPQYKNTFSLTNDTGGFRVNVNFAGPVLNAPQDITLTISLDTAALNAFDNDQGVADSVPPADVFSFPASVVIPKGSRDTHFEIKVSGAADYDYSQSYAVPLTITASSYGAISSNFGTAIYSFIVENKYDGTYSLRERTTGWSAYNISDGPTYNWPNNIGFQTVGQWSNTTLDSYWGNYQLAFSPGGAATAGFGATEPIFTFDPSTNLVTSVANGVPPDSRDRAFALNPAVTDSRWDPTTQNIYVAYIMTQIGRPTQYIYDTLTYVGTR